jgi:hypothetical protein
MSFARKTTICADFPDPVEQAAVILEICRDDICDAREIAVTNVKFARTHDDLLFWSKVQEALSPSRVIRAAQKQRMYMYPQT